MDVSQASLTKLGEVCEFLNGGTPSKSVPRFFTGNIPWITGADITGPVVRDARVFITEEAIRQSATNKVPKGTVLLVTRTSVGKVALAGCELCFSQDITAAKPSSLLHNSYLMYFLHSREEYLQQQARGATIQGITREVIADLTLVLPPFPEQQRIATLLEKADRLRRTRRYARSLSDTFLQSVFLQMFGDPVTNPAGWDVEAVEDLGKVTTGATPPSSSTGMFGGSVPFVTPGDLEVDTLDSQRKVSEDGAKRSRTVRLGSALVCCIGATIGKMDKARTRSAFNQQINAVEWDSSRMDDDFALWMMRFFAVTIAQRGRSTTLPILNKSNFESLPIIAPALEKQQQFGVIVRRFERLQAQQREAERQAEHAFQTLLHRAFSTTE